ncbi:hypothetical protein [Formosa sp. PL04]|uniref:hypothetical protein n=1 Tax=Formosa sp. PL04 TaxID=3081755 RepID=UPI002981C4CC|nr:hypothetical protein [Formosa sp. PL04]MDW5289422.1 hypothetical protein [Formosa sp. PL04]
MLLLSVIYVFLELESYYEYSEYLKGLVVPSFCVFYIRFYKCQLPYFNLFLVLFSISDLLVFIPEYDLLHEDLVYYLGNTLYIMAYLSLLFGILKRLEFRKILSRFKLTISILLVFNIYVLYTLVGSEFETKPLVGIEFVKETIPLGFTMASIILEFVYNCVILVLLTVSFINFLYRDNNKSLFLFLGSLCIVFSEVIQYAIFYPSEKETLLNIVCFVLLVSGYLCFYLFAVQSVSKNVKSIGI